MAFAGCICTALVIGNMAMQDSGWEMHIKSLAGALPIMLGDPRKLSNVERAKYKAYSDWLHTMATRHDIMSYRQILPVLVNLRREAGTDFSVSIQKQDLVVLWQYLNMAARNYQGRNHQLPG